MEEPHGTSLSPDVARRRRGHSAVAVEIGVPASLHLGPPSGSSSSGPADPTSAAAAASGGPFPSGLTALMGARVRRGDGAAPDGSDGPGGDSSGGGPRGPDEEDDDDEEEEEPGTPSKPQDNGFPYTFAARLIPRGLYSKLVAGPHSSRTWWWVVLLPVLRVLLLRLPVLLAACARTLRRALCGPEASGKRRTWLLCPCLRRGQGEARRAHLLRLSLLSLLAYALSVGPAFHFDAEEAFDALHDLVEHGFDSDAVCRTAHPVVYAHTGTGRDDAPVPLPAPPSPRNVLDAFGAEADAGGFGRYRLTVAEEDRAALARCSERMARIPIVYAPAREVAASCASAPSAPGLSDRLLLVWGRQDAAWRHPYHGVENLFLAFGTIALAAEAGRSGSAGAGASGGAAVLNPYPLGTAYTGRDFAGVAGFLGRAAATGKGGLPAAGPSPMYFPVRPDLQPAVDALIAASASGGRGVDAFPLFAAAPATFCSPAAVFGSAGAHEVYWKLRQSVWISQSLARRVRDFGQAMLAAAVWWVRASPPPPPPPPSAGDGGRVSASPLSTATATHPRQVVVVLRGWGRLSRRPDVTGAAAEARAAGATDPASSWQVGTAAAALCASTRRVDNEDELVAALPRALGACAVRMILSREEAEEHMGRARAENTWTLPCADTGGGGGGGGDGDAGRLSLTFVRLELLPFAHQVLLANSADVFLGMHGAGMVHGTWMRGKGEGGEEGRTGEGSASPPRPPSTLVELTPSGGDTIQLYSNIARLAGAEYMRLSYARSPRLEQRMLACAAFRGLLFGMTTAVEEGGGGGVVEAGETAPVGNTREFQHAGSRDLWQALFVDAQEGGAGEPGSARAAAAILRRSPSIVAASRRVLRDVLAVEEYGSGGGDVVVPQPPHPFVRAALGLGGGGGGSAVLSLEERLLRREEDGMGGRSWSAKVLSALASLITPGEDWRVMVKDADGVVDVEEVARAVREALGGT